MRPTDANWQLAGGNPVKFHPSGNLGRGGLEWGLGSQDYQIFYRFGGGNSRFTLFKFSKKKLPPLNRGGSKPTFN